LTAVVGATLATVGIMAFVHGVVHGTSAQWIGLLMMSVGISLISWLAGYSK
jgi:hypothetical protein